MIHTWGGGGMFLSYFDPPGASGSEINKIIFYTQAYGDTKVSYAIAFTKYQVSQSYTLLNRTHGCKAVDACISCILLLLLRELLGQHEDL